MNNIEKINSLLATKKIAVIGYSSKGNMPSNLIYDKFKNNGYEVYAVNPKGDIINGIDCYSSLQQIEGEIDAAIVCTPPAATPEVIKSCGEKGVKYVWIHRSFGEGSYHSDSEKLALDYGIELIPAGCPMMFLKADFAHKIMKMIIKWQGKI